ncbi:hypothetical protein F5146DRAFT_994311 [Armillaria mellea]|nr:hypothetical protein F5146DRAFT_994311 [Armillaria mellea]
MYQFPVSDRKRLHKGNTPTLPQTNYCQLCPAKFTRVTHLQRHIRSPMRRPVHEKRCSLKAQENMQRPANANCGQQCGVQPFKTEVVQVNGSNRHARRPKLNATFEYPCSRCVSRKETCIFLNDPAVSREKRRNAKERRIISKANCRQSPAETIYESSTSSTSSSTSEDSPLSPTFSISPSTPDPGNYGREEGVWASVHTHTGSYSRWSASTSNGEYMDFSWLGADGTGDDDSYYSSVPLSAVVPHSVSTDTHFPFPYSDPTRTNMSPYDSSIGSSTTSL